MDIRKKTPDWPDAFKRLYTESGYWTEETFVSLLDTATRRFSDSTAIVDGEREITYRQFRADTLALAAGMRRLGIRAGDRVVVQMPNSYEFILLSAALFTCAVVPVFALPAHRETELVQFIKQVEAKAYFGFACFRGFDYQRLIASLIADCPSLIHPVFKGAYNGALEFNDMFHAERVEYPLVRSDDVALFQLSGGTTGLPKLITRRHREYLYSIRRSCECCGFDSRTVYLAVLPLGHNFTMSSPGFWGVLREGGCVVVSSSPLPSDAFDLIDRHGVTVAALVPPLAKLWVDTLEPGDGRLNSLRLLQVGGAKLSASVAKRLMELLPCQLQQVFGMAEGLVCYTSLDAPLEHKLNAYVKPMSPDDEVRIVDELGEPVPDGGTGYLLTRGPYTIRGYFDAPLHNSRSFDEEGFYRTGDLVRHLADGRLEVMGRDKDQINKGAEKVSPQEIEEAIIDSGLVSDAVVISQRDEYLGEKIIGVIIANSRTNVSDLKRYLYGIMASYKVPDEFIEVECFPTTSIGKLSRRALRQQVQRKLFEGEEC